MIISVLKKYIWVINLILLAGLSYVLAQIVNDRIKERLSFPPSESIASSSDALSGEKRINGESKQLSSLDSYNVILERNIFGLKHTSSSELDTEDVPQTTLNLELVGTVIGPGEKSTAVIKNLDTNKVRGYLEGEAIDIVTSENVKLRRIENCIAVVERSKGPETIRCKKNINGLPLSAASYTQLNLGSGLSRIPRNTEERDETAPEASEGVKEITQGVYEIDQEMFDDLLTNPNQLVTQVRVIPQEDGLKFFAIRSNSIFFRIGIRNGDVMHRINDVKLDNVESALRLFEELRGQTHFSIDLTRRGQKLTYEYMVR